MKPPQRIIVDGYNVIYTDDRLRRIACKDLQGARSKLLERLEDYLEGRHIQITVVFDGRGGIAETETIIPGRLQVVYSPGSQSADDVIVATLRSSRNPRQFVVVTSDRAHIGAAARGMGCEVVGSRRFLERITASGGHRRAPGRQREPEAGIEFGDADYWLKKFTDDDEETDAD